MEDGTVWSIDLVVIVTYLVGIMLVGIWSVWRQKLTGDVYFLAGRTLGWPVVGAALFASNISTIHLVGLAQDGYQRGLVVGNFEWMATFTLILLALVFAPFYFRNRIATLPEFLEKRYSRLARSIMAFMAILAAVLIHIGISLYAGSAVFEQFFGVPVEVSIIIISTVTAIYTVVGGLRAVVVTETIQSVILLGGAVLITALAVAKLPEHDVHSWADFNRTIDVQHSAEALNSATGLLSSTDWVYNHRDQIRRVAGEFREIGKVLADPRVAEEHRIAAAKPLILALSGGLRQEQRLDDLAAILSAEGAGMVNVALSHDPDAGPSAADVPGSDVPPDGLSEAIRAADARGFTAAAMALTKAVEDPVAVSDDLVWAFVVPIKHGEKLSFIAAEMERAGFQQLAAVVGDPGQWDREGILASARGDLAGAASACRRARAKVLEVGNMNTYLETAAPIRTPRLSMLRADGPYYWLAILLGYPILGVWYWCSDQTIVQRVLGAKNEVNAQNGALFAGLLKITPVFLMVLPGTVAYVILRDKIGDDTAKTLPIMISELMPPGLKGLMAAALMAALMSTIAAALNSVGTLVAKDIVGYFRPQASDAAQVRVGQISAVVLMLLAMAWSTQGGKFGTIFEIINKIPALFLAPPITTVFLWGVFWRRGTKQAAVTVLSLGLSIGFCLFLVDTRQVSGAEWISDERVGLGIPFMMQAVYMFVIWSVLYVAVSLATPAPPREQVENTTWPNPLAVVFRGRLIGWYDPRLLTAGLLILSLVLYWVFR
ncbi:MAG: hypothetical protein FJ276_07390 [Planctomycetes bacterium]|nr:hypothetical protein [Planctomycetota bacterium]